MVLFQTSRVLGIGDGNVESSLLREKLFGSECRTKVGDSVVILDGKVGSSVGISVGFGDGNMGGYPLEEKWFGSRCRTEIGSSVLN